MIHRKKKLTQIDYNEQYENAHLRLSMHKHINVKLLLDLDNLANFFLDGTDVFLLRDPTTTHFNKKKR